MASRPSSSSSSASSGAAPRPAQPGAQQHDSNPLSAPSIPSNAPLGLHTQGAPPPSSSSSSPPKSRRRRKRLRRLRPASWHAAWHAATVPLEVAVATTLFVLTMLYAASTTSLLRTRLTIQSPQNSILVLVVLSEATKVAMAGVMGAAFDRLQGMLLARRKGISFIDYLALDHGSSKLGLAAMLLSRKVFRRLWAAVKLLLVFFVTALSIILLSDTNGALHYISESQFAIAAGVGGFNASWAPEYASIAPLLFQADIERFLTDPARSVAVDPILPSASICTSDDPLTGTDVCRAAYFVPGGLELVTPWPSKNHDLLDRPVYTIDNVQGLQLDFSFAELGVDARFDGTRDCIVLGEKSFAVQMCVTASGDGSGMLFGKMLHCPLSVSENDGCLSNNTWQSSTGWLAAMKPYSRRATVHYSRYNGSIETVSFDDDNVDGPTPITTIAPQDLLSVYNVSFSSNNNLGFSLNTVGQQFIGYMATRLAFAEESPLTFRAASASLRNLLALPLYYFSPLYLSPYTDASGPLPDKVIPGVPRELYTFASLSRPVYYVSVAKWSVWLYAAIGGLVLVSCFVVLALAGARARLAKTARHVPDATAWAAVDLVANCADARPSEQDGLVEKLRALRGRGSRGVVKGVESVRLYARESN